jgi:hypothetical protein
MYHTIEFRGDMIADLETSRAQRLERIRICRGTRLQAQIKPYVVETPDGLVEVADLFFADGVVRGAPFAAFFFVD